MKKNIAMRLASGLMLSCLLSTCVISGTFAKYTSTYTGEDNARVAKWAFKFNGADPTNEKKFTFDLFNTVYELDGTAEDEVKVGASETIIAPGTYGFFTLTLTNASEVTAQYAIDYTVTANDIPLQFSVDGKELTDGSKTWGELADVVASDATKIAYGQDAAPIKIEWRWAFDGNDAVDTPLGEDGTVKITVEADVTVTQVN